MVADARSLGVGSDFRDPVIWGLVQGVTTLPRSANIGSATLAVILRPAISNGPVSNAGHSGIVNSDLHTTLGHDTISQLITRGRRRGVQRTTAIMGESRSPLGTGRN